MAASGVHGFGIQADRRGVIMSNQENPSAGYLIEASKLAVFIS